MYKLSYKFQPTDDRDYKIHSVITDVSDFNNLKVSNTITTKTSVTVTKSTVSTSFTVSVLPNILDQGDLNDCVANAFYYSVMSQTNNGVPLSRLFVYANARCIEFTPLNQDDGCSIRAMCSALSKYGVCKEDVYPYTITNGTELPPLNAYYNTKKFRSFTYTFIKQDLITIKSTLKLYNSPIIFGIMVYPSFMTDTVAKTGIIPMPDTKTETSLGGHCVCLVGYNDTTQMFLCGNSWGKEWGSKGYFYLPYAYIVDPILAADFCVTKFVY
jgi:C1A family cysteine protease